MKLVGFGCSFTYGSELIDPELDNTFDEESQSIVWDRHYANTRYRENNCWLGQLENYLAQPGTIVQSLLTAIMLYSISLLTGLTTIEIQMRV